MRPADIYTGSHLYFLAGITIFSNFPEPANNEQGEILRTNYILIDFENVRPSNCRILAKHPFKIFIFVGENQTKIPYELAEILQTFGENAKYIKITGNGKNALDFHIAYYIGVLAKEDPKAHFHIISKDTGFDPLIRHLVSMNIHVQREVDLAEIPVLRISSSTSTDDKIQAIVRNLAGRGHSRPRKVKTLKNTINSLFTNKLEEHDLTAIIDELQNQKYITVDKGNIKYKLTK